MVSNISEISDTRGEISGLTAVNDFASREEVAHELIGIDPTARLLVRRGDRKARRRLAGDVLLHAARLILAAVVPAGKLGHAVFEREGIDEGPVHGAVGFDLRVREAGIAGIGTVRAAQRARIEHAEAFFVLADHAVSQAIERIAGGGDRLVDRLDLCGIDPAALGLTRGQLARE